LTDAPVKRPTHLNFLKIRDTSRPATLIWDDPGPTCAGLIVYATQNPFPPQMAPQLFAGRMRAFIDEERLEPTRRELRLARPEQHYCVLWADDDDVWREVPNLREPAERVEKVTPLAATVAVQAKTWLRGRYIPGLLKHDERVELWLRDIEPNAAAINGMATGSVAADVTLPARGDGFVDTVTDPEWRRYYAAVAVTRDGVRRPLELELGGFVRLDEPQFIEPDGRRKYDALAERVRDQIEVDIQRRSMTAEELKGIFARADALAPFHPQIARLKQQARERFGVNF
jgi:hypothetical protein